jgi:phosphohistidine swiveling domain-containing protein
MEHSVEEEIAINSASEFTDGQHYSWVWLESLKNWLNTKLIHSSNKLFNNNWMPEWLFEILMYEYNKYLDGFLDKWWILDIEDISEQYIQDEINQWGIVILAWEMNGFLHSILVVWYNKSDKKLAVIDPLKWYKEYWDYEKIRNFSNTTIGRWALSISKTKPQEIDDKIVDAQEKYKRLHNVFSQKKEIIDLDSLIYWDYRDFWNKSYNLSILKNQWYNIVDGVVLSSELLQMIVDNKITDMEEKKIINNVANQLWNDLIVRSNFLWEDGNFNSYAWIFSSYISILPEQLIKTIKKVIQSWQNLNKYSNSDIKPWILIQKMVYWEFSWVAFSKDQNKSKWCVIEIVNWLNENLVNWTQQPYSFNIDHNKKDEAIINSPINQEIINNLSKITEDVGKLFNREVDIEFTIKWDKTYLLQVRPVTKEIDLNHDAIKNNIWMDDMILVSKWEFSWNITYIENKSDIQKIDKKTIVVCDSLYPELLSKSELIDGVISEKGWMLCHFAIVGRELNIPIISNSNGIISILKERQSIACTYKDNTLSFI